MPAQRGPNAILKSSMAKPVVSSDVLTVKQTPVITVTPQGKQATFTGEPAGPSAPGQGAATTPAAVPSATPQGAHAFNKSMGEMVRDNIETTILGNPSDPGHWYESEAATTWSEIQLRIADWKKAMNLQYQADLVMKQANQDLNYYANKAFEKGVLAWVAEAYYWYANASGKWGGPGWEAQDWHAVADAYNGTPQVRFAIDTVEGRAAFYHVWKELGKAGQIKDPNVHSQTDLPPIELLKNFPLDLPNVDTKDADGNVIPSACRVLFEGGEKMLLAVDAAIRTLVQTGKFPLTPILGTDLKFTLDWINGVKTSIPVTSQWSDGTPRFAYPQSGSISDPPQANVSMNSWSPYLDYIKKTGDNHWTAEKVSYIGGYPSKDIYNPLPVLTKEWSDFVAALLRWYVAYNNGVCTGDDASDWDPTGLFPEYPGQVNPKSQLTAYVNQYNNYMAKADAARKVDPLAKLTVAVQKKYVDPQTKEVYPLDAEINAYLQYITIISDIRSIYDNADINKQDIESTKNELQSGAPDMADIEFNLKGAQDVFDGELKQAKENAQFVAAYDKIANYLDAAQADHVENAVDYYTKLQVPYEWKPSPKAQDYLSGAAFKEGTWPALLTNAGIDTWGPLAKQTLVSLVNKPGDWDTKFSYGDELAKAKKYLAQYQSLRGSIPPDYQSTGSGQKKANDPPDGGSGGKEITTPPTENSLAITATQSDLKVGDVSLLSVKITMSDGTTVPNTKPLQWDTSDPAIAVVDANGGVKAIGPGSAIITATEGTIKGSLVVTVQGDEGKVNWALVGGAAAAAFLLISLTGGNKRKD